MKQGWTFQQNNPKHSQGNSRLVSELEWPDLNPIENLLKELKIRVHRRGTSNFQDLKTVCVDEWAKITPEQSMRLVSPFRRLLEAVITKKGFCMMYYINSCKRLQYFSAVSLHFITHDLISERICFVFFVCMDYLGCY